MSINAVEIPVATPSSELEAARAQIESLHGELETRTAIGIATHSGTKIRDLASTLVEQANRRAASNPRLAGLSHFV